MAERCPARLPTPMENLVPMDLRRALQTDARVNTCFHRACYANHTREQALIDIVLALLDEKAQLLAAVRELSMTRQNVIHLDGDRTMLVQKEPSDG